MNQFNQNENPSKKRRWLTTFITITLLVTSVFLSCRKTDLPDNSQTGEGLSIETKFFRGTSNTEPAIAAIINYLERGNQKREFVKPTVDRIGYPRWDKAFKAPKENTVSIKTLDGKNTNGSTNQTGTETYYVPFVRDSQNYVNAAMVIKTGSTDTSISYMCDWQYSQLPNNNNQVNDAAELFAIRFMILDKVVFGHTEFSITDPNLFRNDSKLSPKVTLGKKVATGNVRTNLAELVETCTDVTVSFSMCDYIATQGSCYGPGGSCDHCGSDRCPPSGTLTFTYCWQEWVDGGGGSGSGGSTGGSGGGGGGGGSIPPDPCQPTEGSIRTPQTQVNPGVKVNIVDDCNTQPGWEPFDPIDINILENVDEDIELNPVDDDQTPIVFDVATNPWPTIQNVIAKVNALVYDGRNCLDIAKSQIAQKSLTDLGYSSLTVFQAYKSGVVYQSAAKDGINYIISKLQKGQPVIVGVDVRPGSKNTKTDNTTDHFITIVGSVEDGGKKYLTFYDNASANQTTTASASNRLEYDPVTGIIKGYTSATGYSQGKPYIVTQIRKNK